MGGNKFKKDEAMNIKNIINTFVVSKLFNPDKESGNLNTEQLRSVNNSEGDKIDTKPP